MAENRSVERRQLGARARRAHRGDVELRAAREGREVVPRNACRILTTPPRVDRIGIRLHDARNRREVVRPVRRNHVDPVHRVPRHDVRLRGRTTQQRRTRRWPPPRQRQREVRRPASCSGRTSARGRSPLRKPTRPLLRRERPGRARRPAESRRRHRDANAPQRPLPDHPHEERALAADRAGEALDALAHPLRATDDTCADPLRRAPPRTSRRSARSHSP